MYKSMKPETSKSNCCYLDTHRYYELRHFAMQYPIWKKSYNELNLLKSKDMSIVHTNNYISDPTFNIANEMLFYSARMDMVKNACEKTDANLSKYLFKGLTEGLSFEIINAKDNIPCSKNTYYKILRRCIWNLHKARK